MRDAWSAYFTAMPPLSGARNTRNFVACVTYAFLQDAINPERYARLLYAAQVAHTTRRARKPKGKSGDSSPNKNHSEAVQTGVSALQGVTF